MDNHLLIEIVDPVTDRSWVAAARRDNIVKAFEELGKKVEAEVNEVRKDLSG